MRVEERVQIEEMILHAAYFDPKKRDRIALSLGEHNFKDNQLREFYRALTCGKPLDEFEHRLTIARIADRFTDLNVATYVDEILKADTIDRARHIVQQITARRYDHIDEAFNELEKARLQLEILQTQSSISSELGHDILHRQVDDLMRFEELGGIIDVKDYEYPTGIIAVDQSMGGLATSRYYLIAARPGVGKTTFATTLMAKMISDGVPCAFFTREMSTDEITHKLIARIGQIPVKSIAKQQMTADESDRYANAINILGPKTWYVNQKAMPSLERLERTIRQHVYFHGTKVFFIDYVQIIKVESKSRLQIFDRIEMISQKLQELAKTLHICIVALSQLNRDADKLGLGSKPTSANLKGGGALEQDADAIFIIHSEAEKNKPDKKNFYIIVEKSRFGEAKFMPLTARLDCATFGNGIMPTGQFNI